MKRIDAKLWLLLVLVVPLCGNTCTFHSTSNNGALRIAVCVPSSPACFDPGTHLPPDETDTDTTGIGGQSRTASQPTTSIDQAIRTASSNHTAASLGADAHSTGLELQAGGLEVASQSEPVPALGSLSIAVLLTLVGGTAFRKLRSATVSA
ncbi:MAG: hypothetical protein JRG94_03150 [Deltaproteobacteria bacterium]|nr:hypothetical protein [Deltaproteobacteria bacterium]MBW2725389.1 hypothetical protein [Deltaproteobacteria bacterium]